VCERHFDFLSVRAANIGIARESSRSPLFLPIGFVALRSGQMWRSLHGSKDGGRR
jgi:hypothetical protein